MNFNKQNTKRTESVCIWIEASRRNKKKTNGRKTVKPFEVVYGMLESEVEIGIIKS